jgi:hypothetical protein
VIAKRATDIDELSRGDEDGRLIGSRCRLQPNSRQKQPQAIDHARWLSIFFCNCTMP